MIRAFNAWPLVLLVGFGCGTDSTAPDIPPADALLGADGSQVAATILVQPFTQTPGILNLDKGGFITVALLDVDGLVDEIAEPDKVTFVGASPFHSLTDSLIAAHHVKDMLLDDDDEATTRFMVFHFLPDDVELDPGLQSVCLTGATAADGAFAGAPFTGCVEVLVVWNGGKGGSDGNGGSGSGNGGNGSGR